VANADVAIESIEKHKQIAEMAFEMDLEFETATNALIGIEFGGVSICM
jgi:hypothetical protein